MQLKAKICGISTLEAADTALAGGADFLGFIHFGPSPRHMALDPMLKLIRQVKKCGIATPIVAVVVDPDTLLLAMLSDYIRPDFIQLHGHESPERVAEIAGTVKIPLIKAISVRGAADIAPAHLYEPHVTHLMFDAKPPRDSALPGGMGLSFDWRLMQGYRGDKPWFLAGGLTPENLAEAVRQSGAPMVDVSSGVESSPGVKDNRLISDFLKTAKTL